MKNMKKKLMTLITSVMAIVMVFSTGLTAYAAGDQSSYGKVPVAVTPGGVFIYGCYYENMMLYPVYTVDFPMEYLLAIDAAGITNEMSDYEKCVRINDYLCRIAEYDYDNTLYETVDAAGTLMITSSHGIDLLQYKKGVCSGYADAFQTMTSMLGIESYIYSSKKLNHAWNAVVIDGVRYFTDVTWNDNLNSNYYLMSTELWSDHTAPDIEIDGVSSCGWEVRQAEEQAEIESKRQQREQLDDDIFNSLLNGDDPSEIFSKLELIFQIM